MPPGKRRKVSQDENSARDGVGSRLASSLAAEEKVSQDELGSSPPTDTEKRPRNSSKNDVGPTKNDAGEATAEEPKTSLPPTAKRSSTRVVKKIRRDVSPQGSPVKKSTTAAAKEPAGKTSTPEAKTKRQWESWQREDIKNFYDALFEFGKDFDAIQNVVAQGCRKRGIHPSLIKNKDQVRHFYYRTIHKINKFIETTQDVKKDTQELYALINFGILRKNIKCLNDKTAQKLKELMENGVTCVRVKGKNRRIRTPACSALKKLNNIEEPKGDPAPKIVPDKITLELGPRTNKAWSHVQSVSQNPRLRLKLAAGRSLGSVFTFLEKKWQEHRVKLKESMNESDRADVLTIYPHTDAKINPVVVTRHIAPKVDVTFASYKENVMGSPSTSASRIAKKSTAVEDAPKPSSDNSSEAENVTPSPPKLAKVVVEPASVQESVKSESISSVCPAPELSLLIGDDNAMFPDKPLFCEDDSFTINKPSASANACSNIESDMAVSVNDMCSDDANHGDTPGVTSETGEDLTDSQDSVDGVTKDMVEKAKQGWTAESGQTLTLAQIYLMCGEEGKVRLEYDWCKNNTVLEPHLVSRLTNMLRRLAHIATIEFVDPTRTKETTESLAKKQILCSLCGAVAERSRNKSVNSKSKSGKPDKNSEKLLENKEVDITTIPASTATLTCITASSATRETHVKPRIIMSASRKQIIPNSGDGVFRVPMGVPLVRYPQAGVMHGIQQKQSIQMIPKRRKMVRPKPLIVQRTLLPKAPSGQIVTILPSNVISPHTVSQGPQSVTPQTFSPASLTNRPTGTSLLSSHTIDSPGPAVTDASPLLSQSVSASPQSKPISIAVSEAGSTMLPSGQPINVPLRVNTDISAAATPNLLIGTSASDVTVSVTSGQSTNSRSADLSISPPNLSSLLDMSLSCPPGNVMADKILDMALVNSNSSFSALLDTASPKIGSSEVPASSFRSMDESSRLITPPHSPSHMGGGADTQWLNGVVGDMSLTSFLISPAKKSESSQSAPTSTPQFPSSIFSENSQESIVSKMDVDQTLQVMMNENSMDYVSKFESLAAHIDGCMPSRNKDSKT